nr:acyl-CoA dehydrogenase [Alkalihalobacillus pseudalcaliphilus]
MNNVSERLEQAKQRKEKLLSILNEFSLHSAQNDEESRFPIENITLLKKIDYPAYNVATEFQGGGALLSEWLEYQMLIAKQDGATALAIGWHMGLMEQLREHNNWHQDMYELVIQDVVENGALINAAQTEAATGSPTRGGMPATHARKEGDNWVINGHKTFTTMAPVLDYFLVSATITEDEKVANFLIHKNAKGLRIEETWDMVAMRATASHDLIFEHVQVPLEACLETVQRGKAAGWLLHIPACYLGIAKAAHEYAIDYAKSYSPNSIKSTISELPNVRAKIGEAELLIRQSESYLFDVAKKWEMADESNRQLLKTDLGAVKYVVVNHAHKIVDLAMRIVGAHSLRMDVPLQRYYRDVRAGLHNPPMDDMTIQSLALEALSSK